MKTKVVWQHAGRLFCARTVVSGLASDRSPVIEPDLSRVADPALVRLLDYGDGFYLAPGMPQYQLVVGEVLIAAYFRGAPRTVKAAGVDKYGRRVLSLVSHQSNIEKVRRVHSRLQLLDEHWDGERI